LLGRGEIGEKKRREKEKHGNQSMNLEKCNKIYVITLKVMETFIICTPLNYIHHQ
jgi:hypothetical protein